jgi:hypothetical protein
LLGLDGNVKGRRPRKAKADPAKNQRKTGGLYEYLESKETMLSFIFSLLIPF